MTFSFDHVEDRDAIDLKIAREVLAIFRPGFEYLSADEQLQEIADFVLERREELARSPDLQKWLLSGLN